MAKRFSPTLAELRASIAGTISAEVKAYDLVETCAALGIEKGDGNEAWQSKSKYVDKRIFHLDKEKIIRLARDVLAKWDSFSLRECLRRFLCDNRPRLTIVTRQRLCQELDAKPALNGHMAVTDFIGELMPVNELPSLDPRFSTFFGEILQHTERNDDWDNSQILERIGVMTASDEFLCEFLELLVHPTVRDGIEQSEFVTVINRVICVDGFALEEADNMSGVPVFALSCPGASAKGRPKNLIFASTGPKPEILLADAVDNDIRIATNAQYVLVYDRLIVRAGLTWVDLLNWWKSHPAADLENIEHSLYHRLLKSLTSPPEQYFFRAYYTAFKDRLNEWPALIPQVYLHYDPKTVRELDGARRFLRQRMDFLLLLPDRVRVVVEIDGKQHYALDDGMASPRLYAEMMREDRLLRLKGYELYRFGGHELQNYSSTEEVVRNFFNTLMERHQPVR
jgi:very-short-patch-repair endonuclease